MTKANPDSIAFANPTRAAEASMAVLDALQFLPSNDQYHALACVFVLMSEELGLDIRQELERAPRIMRDADRVMRPEFKAVAAYIHGELTS